MNSIENRSTGKMDFAVIFAFAIVIISFFPVLHWTEIGPHDNQRLGQTLVTIIGGLIITHQLIRAEDIAPLLRKESLYFLIGFFFFGLSSSLLAWSFRHAMFEWANSCLLLGLACLIAKKISTAPSEMLGRILLVCGAGCALYLFSWLVAYLPWLIGGIEPDLLSLIPGFDNFRFFNHVQTVTLPLLGLLVSITRQHATTVGSSRHATLSGLVWRHQAHFWWMVLMLWWTLLFLSSGRGTFVGVLAGLILVLVWRRRHALEWCRVMVLTFVAGLVAYQALYIFMPTLVGIRPIGLLHEVASRTIANPTSSRLQLWQRALETIIDHPIFGAGPLHFAHLASDIKNGAHPHNWMLQIGAEWGIPALLCLAGVLVTAFLSLRRTARAIESDDTKNQAILAASSATLVAIVVDGLVSGIIVMPASQLWIALYAGCAWGWTASYSVANSETRRTPLRRRYPLILGIIVAIYFVGYGVWPEITHLRAREVQIIKEGSPTGTTMFSPRIWRVGYF